MEPAAPANTQALPPGTRLEEFEIERVLGAGGFGITYLAHDTSLNRQVVIKENLPVQFAYRDNQSLTVAPRHSRGEDLENFQWSLDNFTKEAALLASLDHPGIVKVLRSFRSLGTAFFIMPYVDGIAFDELIKERRSRNKPFSEEELRGMTERVLTALAYLHDRGIYHRDIKPGNILITNDGIPVLIDFGSARQRLSERSMTVVESPGYTPFEQLQSRGNVGPWSDLYALGATLEKAIAGHSPPKVMDRIRDDPRFPCAQRANLRNVFSSAFLEAIDRALEVNEAERWQDADEWSRFLIGRSSIYAVQVEPDAQQQSIQSKKTGAVGGNFMSFQEWKEQKIEKDIAYRYLEDADLSQAYHHERQLFDAFVSSPQNQLKTPIANLNKSRTPSTGISFAIWLRAKIKEDPANKFRENVDLERQYRAEIGVAEDPGKKSSFFNNKS
jgi:serine/threonine protein kinase